MKNAVLGIDIGTSACKAALFDETGGVLGVESEAYPVAYPHPGWAEQNPDQWWGAVCRALGRLWEKSGVSPGQVAAVGVDGQSWSAVPVDKNGKALAPTPIWMDTRAQDICERVQKQVGEARLFAVAKNRFSPSYSTPKMLWFAENAPEIYEKTACFLQSNSYIVLRLSGERTQDVSQGYGVHFFDQQTLQWDASLARELGLSVDRVPEHIAACHEVVGGVNEEAARQTGLRAGTPVVAGGLDAACGTLGAGVLHAGETQEQGGQAGGMSICLETPAAHPSLILSAHVVPGRWLLQGGTVGGGGVMRWMQETLTPGLTFQEMDALAAAVPPGSDGVLFLPYMAGERSPLWMPEARGVYYGLGFEKGAGHLIRAGLEGVALSLEHNLRCAQEAGARADTLRAMGGAANSRLWTQIKADVTGRTIEVPASDTATTLGAAMLAGVGVGLWPDFETAVAKSVRVRRVHRPDAAAHAVYQKTMERYLALCEVMLPVFQQEQEVRFS